MENQPDFKDLLYTAINESHTKNDTHGYDIFKEMNPNNLSIADKEYILYYLD